MPVKLEHIRQPDAADWQDIAKIQQDAGTEILLPAALESALQQGHWLVAARFNDRLVGVILCSQNGDMVTLEYAAVRSITQRRGVMHQTITLLQQWADHEQVSLLMTQLPAELAAAAQRRDFRETAAGWCRDSNNLSSDSRILKS